MADLPAETELTGETLARDTQEPSHVNLAALEGGAGVGGNDVTQGFMNLPFLRQIALMVGFAAIVSLGVLLALWSQDRTYKPLYTGLAASEISKVVQVLDLQGIEANVEPGSGLVLVPATDLHKARMVVAGSEVLPNRVEGYQVLDQETPLGTSQFMETARYWRAVEGELEHTIASLQQVQSARVKLAIPKRSVFVRDRRDPSASVVLQLSPGQSLEQKQVKSIMHMVAHSVPEMDRKNVTVVDQASNLLSAFDDGDAYGQAQRHFQIARELETAYLDKIDKVLARWVGDTRFDAQVSADMDFTATEQTREDFDPNRTAVRSSDTLEEVRSGGDVGGIPGALSNQPGAEGTAPETLAEVAAAGAEELKSWRTQRVTNVDISRGISHTKHQVGRVSRLTAAIVLDDTVNVGEDGTVSRTAWTPEQLSNIQRVIEAAIGFSAERGDVVTVINQSFAPTETVELVAPGFWTEAWFRELVKLVMVGLLILLLILGVLKPVLNMLAGPSAEDRMKALMAEQELERLAEAELEHDEELMADTVTLSGGEELLLPGPGEIYARQLDAIKGLVAENPSRVAQVLKAWIAEE